MNYKQLARVIERAKQGDEEAFANIYSEFFKPVYFIGLRMTQNESDARDVVQETMLKLHLDFHSIKNAESIVSFINRIATCRCIDLMRKKNPTPDSEGTESAMESAHEEKDDFIPEAFLQNKEQREYVVKLIDELGETQKSVVLMYYYRQLSCKQIAEILDIDEVTVRKRLSRARTELKKELSKDKWEDLRSMSSIPILTQILQMEADAAANSKVGSQVWQSVGSNLGYSEATITATTPAAIGYITSSAATVATGGVAALSTIAKATIITAVAILGTGLITYTLAGNKQATSLPTPAPQQSVAKANTSAPQNAILPVETTGIDITSSPDLPPVDETTEPDENAVSNTNNHAEGPEAITSAPPSGNVVMTAKKDKLTYPAGASVTPDQVLKEAGISAYGADGKSLTPEIKGFEDINFQRPGVDFVYAYVGGKNGIEYKQIVIKIIITANGG